MKKFSLILLLSSLSAMTNSQFYDDSWAVIIGINNYHNIKRLNYAVDDAQDIHDMLVTKFHFPEDNIALLINEEATYNNIITSLNEMAEKVGKNDRLIIFFAGHGTQRKLPSGGEKGYLLPVDVDTSKLYLTGIDMTDIKDVSEMTNAKHVLYLMDACYGGLMAISRAIDKKAPGYLSMRKRTQGKGRQIITAGGKDEESQERPAWGHSAFTKNLLSGLQDEMADIHPEDGYITAYELGLYLKDKVELDSDYAQTPQIQQYGSGVGEFVFTVTSPAKEDSTPEATKQGTQIKQESFISIEDLEKIYLKYGNKYSGQSSEKSVEMGKDHVKEWKLPFADTDYIDTTDISGKWLKMPGPRFNFNRVDGFGLGLGKTFTRLSPFPYELDMKSHYNFSRKEPDYHFYLKRYLWNREFQYLSASMYQESRTYDDWSVVDEMTNRWVSSFLFNIDHFDYYLADGLSLYYKYYNQDGFSIKTGFRSEKQQMLNKKTDFSVFQYNKEYRKNYFSTNEHFVEGTLSSLNIEFGFNGATWEYNLSNNWFNEIEYELDISDIPLEYTVNNYNLINLFSNTIGEPDTTTQDSLDLIHQRQSFEKGWYMGGGFRDSTKISPAYREELQKKLAMLDSSYLIKKDWYTNYIDSNLVGIQFIDYSIDNPLGDATGVRYFGVGTNGQQSKMIFLDNARVEEEKTYIFSFWVRSVQDTINISPGLSSHNNTNLTSREWEGIGTKWKRVWVSKTFEEVKNNPRTFITTSSTKPIYVWGAQLEEVHSVEDMPTEYQSTDGKPFQIWLVAESPNWLFDKILMGNNNNQIFQVSAVLPRGRYAYRFQIGDHSFLDPKATKRGKNNNGENVSVLEVGLQPKWNFGFEYSDPALGSEFRYERVNSNLRFIVPISYTEMLFFRIVNGWVSETAPKQRHYYLGNVRTLRGYDVKEFSGEQMMLLNLEYQVNIAKWIRKIFYQEKMIFDFDILKINNKNIFLSPTFKPFIFYDVGIIGSDLNDENTHTSVGFGLEVIGLRLMAAKRLDRDQNSWSVLLDFGGIFFGEYLP